MKSSRPRVRALGIFGKIYRNRRENDTLSHLFEHDRRQTSHDLGTLTSSNHMMGNTMSGNVATCLMSTTWLTARLICTRALARMATPISCGHVIKIIHVLNRVRAEKRSSSAKVIPGTTTHVHKETVMFGTYGLNIVYFTSRPTRRSFLYGGVTALTGCTSM